MEITTSKTIQDIPKEMQHIVPYINELHRLMNEDLENECDVVK